ncbi:MAG: EAL domain-containing protein [Pseudomonadota bacterium]|nr:EAL domain-containing protein [Pseudomonadota bacterium]MDP1906236.1 EAL domain-containing protein [Pseudomonadota bacterium]MDP2353960.1 EAL domain-containing protein [Pseudomonadota bacterium]
MPHPHSASDSIARQAGRRAIAIFLIIGGLSSALFSLAWFYANGALQSEQAARNTADIAAKLEARYARWQREAEALATQITYNRMLESGDDIRWDKLRAYINAQGEGFRFDTVAVTDNAGTLLFSHGEEAEERGFLSVKKHPNWYFSAHHQHLHRVLRTPIWLGLHGKHGTLFLLKSIDNRLLADLSGPAIELTLSIDGVTHARGEIAGGRPRQGADAGGGVAEHDLLLAPPNIRLTIRQMLSQALSPLQFALAGIALTAILGLTLWLALGSWLRRTVARVRGLSQAADRFGRLHRLDKETDAALDSAAGDHDEVGALLLQLRGLMQASEERDEESRAYLQTLEMLEEAVVELDVDGNLLRASPAWDTLMGPNADTREFFPCFEPEDQEDLQHQIALLFSGEKDLLTLRLRIGKSPRSSSWLECRFVPVKNALEDGAVTHVRGVLRDITQTYLQEKHITHMALHDALTGLPNRVLLEDRLKVALRLATREHSRVGIGFIDLDHFKNINDALGHKAGDQLLVAFANALRTVLRTGDTLARWGGDEFVVLLPDMPGVDEIRHVADKLSESSREPVSIDNHSLPVTFSMGFTVFPDDGDDVDVLLSQADRAMFHAKSQGRNMVQFFADMTRKGLGKKDLYIQSRLAAAINNGAIQTWFQPLVDARTHRAVGLEALARWHDPELGWVSPATFIPMAENLGLIAELGDQVFTHTLTLGRSLMDAGHDLTLAVNISKRQLFLANCVEQLLRDANTAGIAPGKIMLEITESVAMSAVDFAETRLRDLHDAGFKLAVDDFGVGYSSLSQLHEMPVDELKIDISFTRRARDPQGARLIQAITGMAQALNLHIVAEGVEDGETAAILNTLGVHSFQGYHFGKPMPAAEIAAWLEANKL